MEERKAAGDDEVAVHLTTESIDLEDEGDDDTLAAERAQNVKFQVPAQKMMRLKTQSFTQQKVGTLAAPARNPKPRSIFRMMSSIAGGQRGANAKKNKTEERPVYVATRANAMIIQKSNCSRITYSFVLLNLIVWMPLWLKLVTLTRRDYERRFNAVYNMSVTLDLHVGAFDGGVNGINDVEASTCQLCDRRDIDNPNVDDEARKQQNYQGVTYPISAKIHNYAGPQEVGAAGYVLLYGSTDFVNWDLYNTPGELDTLAHGSQTIEVCSADPYSDDAYADADDDDLPEGPNQAQTIFTSSLREVEETTTSADEFNDLTITATDQWETTWTTLGPTTVEEKVTAAPTPLEVDDEKISRCCLGDPGFVYLVACATPFGSNAEQELNTQVAEPGFEDRCVAVDGRCGVQCGAEAHMPTKEETCVDGKIPLDYLVRREVQGFGTRRYYKRHRDKAHELGSLRGEIYHKLFVLFVTMMAVGTWISFLPGNGIARNAPKPNINEVEEYFSTNDQEMKPLMLVMFSISASEPRVIVLRNMIGKLMSLINQRKFTLLSKNPPTTIYTRAARELSTIFGEDDNPNLKPRSSFVVGGDVTDIDHAEGRFVPSETDRAEIVDLFQDEGHRVGAYALWDAFIDISHDCDLRFLEQMALKMTDMPADRDFLTSKVKADDTLLDDELRALAAEDASMGISGEDIDKLELAFGCFDLLTKLGHHAFWRSDRNVHVLGFRELASDPVAVRILKMWAKTYKKGKKSGADPFDSGIVPSSEPGIAPDVWQSWWELYSELGKSQWMKRFDTTKFRLCRVFYYRNVENKDAKDVCRDVMMCYSARANPEDLATKFEPTTNIRGIHPGVFVRLKNVDDDKTEALFSRHGLRHIQRSEARRCHARVICVVTNGTQQFIKVRECTPDLLSVIPTEWLACRGVSDLKPTTKKKKTTRRGSQGGSTAGRSSRTPERDPEALEYLVDPYYEGEEAIIPYEVLQPLRPSRGKSGGMNHCMEILDHYIRFHSNTWALMIAKHRHEAVPKMGSHASRLDELVDAHLFFAIFDCRHMGQKGFWDAVIPYFYRYTHPANPWIPTLEIDATVAFVQLPQTFTSLTLEADIFDMRNEYMFRLANNLRNGVGAITSCGTNAVWNYDIYFQENPLEHRFNEDTMIEDTASSHDVIIEGRKGVYHFERLVLGARKDSTDYLAAVFRWSRGAVQLSWTTFWFPRYFYFWPWVAMLIHVIPIVGTIIYFQLVNVDECGQTALTRRSGLIPCELGVIGLALDPVFVLFTTWMIGISAVAFYWARLGAYTVMFENVTYFFTAVAAFFWLFMPMYMCMAKQGLPPVLDTQLVTIGGLWIQIHMALIIRHIKAWSPLENGTPPSNQSLLRSQQKFFVTAPLHMLALVLGSVDGFNIVFRGKDASRWSSFDNKMAMTSVKCWCILMVVGLLASLGIGLWRMIMTDADARARGARFIGIYMVVVILFLIETPVRAMFFFESTIKKAGKQTRVHKITKGIFGSKTVFTPDFFYLVLWTILLGIALNPSTLGESGSILNFRSRCGVDGGEDGCKDSEEYYIARTQSRFFRF